MLPSVKPTVRFSVQLPEAFAHGAVDNEVEAGIECDEKRGHAGHDEHPAGEAEAGIPDLRDDEHLRRGIMIVLGI